MAEDGDIQRSVLYAGADHVLRKVLNSHYGSIIFHASYPYKFVLFFLVFDSPNSTMMYFVS